MDSQSRRRRTGTSLVEVMLAACILSGLMIAFMTMFTGTQRQSTASEARLHASVLAQIVVERIRANVVMNPSYFRTRAGVGPRFTVSGTVVDPAAASSRGLVASPFFENLFHRSGAGLALAPNKASLAPAAGAVAAGPSAAELQALVETFRDFQVTVTVDDDVDLEPDSGGAVLREMVKRVTVLVSRLSASVNGAQDPHRFKLTTRLVTPTESLTDATLAELVRRFEGPTKEQLWDEYFMVRDGNPYLDSPGLGLESKRILADLFLILEAANQEGYLVEGTSVPGSGPVEATGTPTSLDSWIARLKTPESYATSVCRKEAAKLQLLKADLIFVAFKKMRPVLEHLVAKYCGPVPGGGPSLRDRVRDLITRLRSDALSLGLFNQRLSSAIGRLAAPSPSPTPRPGTAPVGSVPPPSPRPTPPPVDPNSADLARIEAIAEEFNQYAEARTRALEAHAELIMLVSYMRQLFQDPAFGPILSRPLQYETRFKQTLTAATGTLKDHMDQPDGPTPYEAMASVQAYAEVIKVRQLVARALDPEGTGRLKAQAGLYAPRTAPLAAYLDQGEVHDLATLQTRNASFMQKVTSLETQMPRYGEIVAACTGSGEIVDLLALLAQVSKELKLETGSAMSQLARSLRSAGSSLASIGSATDRQLRDAARNASRPRGD